MAQFRYSTKFRDEVLEEVSRGIGIRLVASKHHLATSTLNRWRSRAGLTRTVDPDAKPKRWRVHVGGDPNVGKLEMTREDLSYPPATIEAQSLFKSQHRLGGVEKVRKLIEIDPLSRAFLDYWQLRGWLPASTVIRAIEYREQVLEEFDRLVAREHKRHATLTLTLTLAANNAYDATSGRESR